MTDVTNRSLPPPKNWQDFEHLCYDLYSRKWQTNDAEMHGRQGQPQAGVDIYGHDQTLGGRLVGVQCKGKDQTYGEILTDAELRKEIGKAKGFIPTLDIFVVATTAPNDERIQEAARTISEAHRSVGLFEVRVQGWGTLQQWISDYRDLLEKYFPDLYPPSETLARIDLGIETTRYEGEATRVEIAKIQSMIATLAEVRETADPLKSRILDAAKLSDDGAARASLRALHRIESGEADRLSSRNLYILRSSVGFANLALGEQAAAIQSFRAAYDADPLFPNSRAILALAELLEGNKSRAFELARTVIDEDPTSYHAAAVVLDAAADDVSLEELEALIPDGLKGRTDILVALSLRAQKSSDLVQAERYAREALSTGSNDLRAQSTLASVLMEPIARLVGVYFTRLVPKELQSRLEEALQLLKLAWAELRTRDDLFRYDHVVANLMVVLDLSGRETEADRILDEALRSAPRSPPLLRRYALRKAEADDWEAVQTAISSLPAAQVLVQDEIIEAHALFRMGELKEALSKVRVLQARCEETRSGEAAATLRLEIAAQLGCLDTELTLTLNEMPSSIMLRSVAASLLSEGDPRREGIFSDIKGLVSGLTDPRDQFHAAEALYQAKQYDRAAELYAGLRK